MLKSLKKYISLFEQGLHFWPGLLGFGIVKVKFKIIIMWVITYFNRGLDEEYKADIETILGAIEMFLRDQHSIHQITKMEWIE